MSLSDRSRRKFEICFLLAVFAALLVFFEAAHRLVILDGDDWTYIAQSRTAIPGLRFWNPARILPEILMPWCSGLAVMVIMPLCKDYITALTIMNGIVLSSFITLYIFSLYRLLTVRFGASRGIAALLSVLFLLFHFWAYRTHEYGNAYLFMAVDVTCVYYYTIPTLLNASLVMLFAAKSPVLKPQGERELLRLGALLAVIYLAVYSNLFSSYIIAIYAGLELLFDVFGTIRRKDSFKTFLCRNVLWLGIVAAWLLSALLEGMGTRGESGYMGSFFSGILASAKLLPQVFLIMNRLFLLLCTGTVGLAILVMALKKDFRSDYAAFGLRMLAGFAVSALYLVLLCAKVNPSYMLRPDVLLALLFWLFALVIASAAYLLSEYPRCAAILPLLLLICFSNIICSSRTFGETNDLGIDPGLAADVDRALIEQVLEADRAGETRAVINVLRFGDDECHWPHAAYLGERMAPALYKHGMTSRLMDIEIVPSQEFTDLFGLG